MKRYIVICVAMGLLTGCVGHSMRQLPPAANPPAVPGVQLFNISAETIQQNESSMRARGADAVELATTGAAVSEYRIGVHDILTIIVWDHPELTTPTGTLDPQTSGYLVGEDGTIFYPYVGKVSVAGKTPGEVREIISKGLEEVIQKPQVDVKVGAYRSQKVFVSGEVARPGLHPITDSPITVQEALSLAGDATVNGDLTNISLTRGERTYIVDMLAFYDDGDTGQNVVLRHGDVLHVPDRNAQKVFVIGEVLKPSSIVMNKRGITLTEAIADAGGVNPETSVPAKIFVLRGTEAESEIFHLDASSPDALVLGDHFRLHPRDVVYVETAPIARWNRVINQILPLSNVVRNFGRITGSQ